jgi:hypothetical protein
LPTCASHREAASRPCRHRRRTRTGNRSTRLQTLLDGKYKPVDDQPAKQQDELAGTSEANVRDAKASVARYVSTSESGVLAVSGMHGRIKDTDEARTLILKGAEDADGSTIAVPAADFTPTGSEVIISCQVLTAEQADSGTSTLPMCAWADENTNAAVAPDHTGDLEAVPGGGRPQGRGEGDGEGPRGGHQPIG